MAESPQLQVTCDSASDYQDGGRLFEWREPSVEGSPEELLPNPNPEVSVYLSPAQLAALGSPSQVVVTIDLP